MTIIADSKSCLKNLALPEYYVNYQESILQSVQKNLNVGIEARRRGIDVTDRVEPKIAFDLSDRVAKMHDIDIAKRLRELLSNTSKERAALKIAEEIALGEYGEDDLRTRLDNAVRVSLAVVTEGVTIAPLQGIADVQLKKNSNSKEYLSISFAGPIRSAGGTEAALTMLIADHARKIVGVDSYSADSFDDETGRFVEELRIYEREVGSFQFKVLDEDVIKCISRLPVELDGVDTDPVEVVGHRGMKRISTDRVRGGALRVMNDGLIGRSRKLLKLVEELGVDGWDWLNDLKGAIQTGNEDAVYHRMSEVITGRPVLSMTKKIGGFRLRYGRCYNTGFATIGIHPTIPILLNHAVVVGTQIKMDVPGKASTLALVDSIEPPLVKLDDGNVLYVSTVQQAIEIRSKVEKIIYLGDILISYGDFLENNAQLLPASYVEEIWALQLKSKLISLETNQHPSSSSDTSLFLSEAEEEKDGRINLKRIVQLVEEPLIIFPTVKEAFEISRMYHVPLHPRYSFYWESVSIDEVLLLKDQLVTSKQNNNDIVSVNLTYNPELKDILERLGVVHSVENGSIRISNTDQIYALRSLLLESKPYSIADSRTSRSISPESPETNDILGFISRISGVEVMSKFASSIAVRVGRPEKAAERKMKPPVHVLFPVGTKGGATRDILKAAKGESFYAEIANRFCIDCNLPSVGTYCRKCGAATPIRNLCIFCKRDIPDSTFNNRCDRCHAEGKTYSPVSYPLNTAIEETQQKLKVMAVEPLKGVRSLISKDKAAEPLEKGVLRQKHNLYTFKDGTIRFDATNEPLTHFKPKWIRTSIERLKDLGYKKDYLGRDIVTTDQLVELFMQDIIIPSESAKHLIRVSKFIDEELVKLYGLEPFYNVSSVEDLVGHFAVGLAPHTSVGIIGRIIGFTDSQVCLASPIWHSAKRRDCDGDADSMMLLMDAFLNFSYSFLPNKIGGLMDAPLLIQPLVLPHEVQRQAHNIDISSSYPLEFYQATWKQVKSGDLSEKIETIKDRIGKENQFFDYGFTHFTDLLTTNVQRSAYSRLNTMDEKLEMQISTAKLINAVDPDEVVSMVLTTHILPDIMGNMRAYSSQAFRCSRCGEKYRRIPLIGKCTECGNELLQTVTRGSVEKYIDIAAHMCEQFKISDYLRCRVKSLTAELDLIFQQQKKNQFTLTDFME
ncbi:MAG TPA: DNA polymerase II large subunit [Nitrososphaeraceae archaeon]|nr:DNA polymerase II large subunit [Nitrososphaeraceae archaeon]